MFLQDAPADTTSYMVLGLGVILGTIALYVVSVWRRTRNSGRDLAALSEIRNPRP